MLPPLIPNTLGQETEYQAQLECLQALPSTLALDIDYWGSVTTTSSLPSLTSCASTLESEYYRSRALASPAIPDVCLCGIDICYCEAPVPNTPPTRITCGIDICYCEAPVPNTPSTRITFSFGSLASNHIL